MMDTLRVVWAVFTKDLIAERRTKDVSNAILLFGFAVAVSFTFAFDPTTGEARRIAGGLLWLAFLFASLLGLSRSFARELNNDTLQALRLIPVDLGAVYLGKLLSNILFMLIAESVLVLVFGLFFNVNLWLYPMRMAAVLALGTWGVASIGTLFAALSANTRMRELMLPLMLLPLAIPVLVATMAATTSLIQAENVASVSAWLRLLIAFDVIFTVLCWLLFESVVQE